MTRSRTHIIALALLALLVMASSGSCTCGPPAPKPSPSPTLDAGQDGAGVESGDVASRATAGLAEPLERPDSFKRGISLGMFVSSDDQRARRDIYTTLLDEIAQTGARDVQIVVRWAQADTSTTLIEADPTITVEDEELLWILEQARARRLRTFLMPILHLRARSKGQWRGTIRPSSWDAWWSSYEAFILHYAQLAQAAEVDLLAIGSELVSTEVQKERWYNVIAQVRSLFKGQLTYSANWDHFEPIQFWDALDVVGVTAYQPLSKRKNPTEADMVEGWQIFVTRLRFWAARKGYRYVFTEVGYPSNPFGAFKPWDYRERGQADHALQLRCYRALYGVWQKDPRLAGIYFWNWFGFKNADDRGYTPRGKPAEHVIGHWYKGSTP